MDQYIVYILTALVILLPYLILKLVGKWRRVQALRRLKPQERQQLDLIRRGDFQNFKALVDSMKFDPNFRDPINQGTLLMMCVPDDRKVNFAQYLIEKGCDYNAVDKKGMDMLFVTTYWKCPDLFELIIKQKGLNLDRSNFGLRFEMNPLTACIYKSGDIAQKLSRNINPNDDESELEKDIIFFMKENKYYYKAYKLLLAGANPTIARRIIEKHPNHYEAKAYQQFEPLLDFFERWYNSKRVLLMDYYLGKEGRPKNEGAKKNFAIEKLPFAIVSKIAHKYL